MKDAGVQCVVGDQLIIAARTVAERLGVPFRNDCSSIQIAPIGVRLLLPWGYRRAWWARGRNWLVYSLGAFFSTPISRKLNSYRTQWALAPHRKLDDTFSPLAQITQLSPSSISRTRGVRRISTMLDRISVPTISALTFL